MGVIPFNCHGQVSRGNLNMSLKKQFNSNMMSEEKEKRKKVERQEHK